MSEHKVAHRYAKALIDLNQATNSLEQGYKDMKEFHAVISKNPQLLSLFKSPIVHGHKKIEVMKAIFEKSLSKMTMDFFTIIISKKREYYVAQIAQAFIDQYNVIMNIGTAEVRTAAALDAKTNDAIRKYIEQVTGKKMEITTKVDESLIGGLVIKTADKLYDASISGSLQKAKQELLNTYISK